MQYGEDRNDLLPNEYYANERERFGEYVNYRLREWRRRCSEICHKSESLFLKMSAKCKRIIHKPKRLSGIQLDDVQSERNGKFLDVTETVMSLILIDIFVKFQSVTNLQACCYMCHGVPIRTS